MRILHTSDWHLGRTLHGVDLLDAQRAVLAQICELVASPADSVPVDAVLVAGDIYDRAVPPVEAVALFADTLAELTRHTTVVITGGNHDSAIRLGFGAELFTPRLHLRTQIDSVGLPVMVGGVAIYPIPYLDPDAARTRLSEGAEPLPRSHQAVMAAALRRVRDDLGGRPAGTRSVVVAHAFVVGGTASDSERSIAVGGVDCVGVDTFDGIDYVALGHLHGAQQLSSRSATVLRYSGSPLRYSFSELTHTKSVTLVDFEPSGPVRTQLVPLRQPRAMAELTGTLEELVGDSRFVAHGEDWVRVTVTDRSRPAQLFDRIKSQFPFVLQVSHVPAGQQWTDGPQPAAATDRSPRDLGSDFVREVTGLPADAAELALFEAAFREAQVDAGRPA